MYHFIIYFSLLHGVISNFKLFKPFESLCRIFKSGYLECGWKLSNSCKFILKYLKSWKFKKRNFILLIEISQNIFFNPHTMYHLLQWANLNFLKLQKDCHWIKVCIGSSYKTPFKLRVLLFFRKSCDLFCTKIIHYAWISSATS